VVVVDVDVDDVELEDVEDVEVVPPLQSASESHKSLASPSISLHLSSTHSKCFPSQSELVLHWLMPGDIIVTHFLFWHSVCTQSSFFEHESGPSSGTSLQYGPSHSACKPSFGL
jgi:hypothetical protein